MLNMKRCRTVHYYCFTKVILFLLVGLCKGHALGAPAYNKGFMMTKGRTEVTMNYKQYGNLIVLSTRLNDRVPVNLILDTGCRNIVLFGKKYLDYVNELQPGTIQFKGLGNPNKPLAGKISLDNSLTLDEIHGKGITVVVVPSREIMSGMGWIDGVIGYDLLSRFEIEVKPDQSIITFRPSQLSNVGKEYEVFPLTLDDVIPVSRAHVEFDGEILGPMDMLIDTGSQFGFIYKSNNSTHQEDEIIGRGMCGIVKGKEHYSLILFVNNRVITTEFNLIKIKSFADTGMSMGMEFLKDRHFIINYVKGFFALADPGKTRKNSLILPEYFITKADTLK